MMFVRKQHTQEPKEPKVCDWNHLSSSVIVPAKPTSRRDRGLELTQSHFAAQTKTCEYDGQFATKTTSALTDTCIQFPGPVMSTLVKTLCLSLVLMTIFLTVCYRPFSPSFVTMSSSKPIGVCRVNRWTKNADQRREDYYYDALVFSRHNIDLVFDEENMEPEKLEKAPKNAGIDPSTMRVSKCYRESTREDDDLHLSSSSRVSEVITGTNRSSYQVREPIENDEERLAMKRGDMPPPVPERVDNPRIREDQALLEFYSNSDRIHRTTSEDAHTQAWFQ